MWVWPGVLAGHARMVDEHAAQSLCIQCALRTALSTPQVAQLEMQLAAAERCAAELRELSAQLGSVRQEDVEVLKARTLISVQGKAILNCSRTAASVAWPALVLPLWQPRRLLARVRDRPD